MELIKDEEAHQAKGQESDQDFRFSTFWKIGHDTGTIMGGLLADNDSSSLVDICDMK